MRILLSLALIAAAGCGGNQAAVTPADPIAQDGDVLAFRGVRIFDGETVRGPGNVIVRGEAIVEVGKDVAIPAGATIIDGAGKTLLPGLIDAHAHIWAKENLVQSAAFGVTTVLDMMTAPAMVKTLKATLDSPAGKNLADLRSAGNPVTAPGGHGTEYGLPIRTLAANADVQAFVDACIAEGSDYIKIIYTPGSERFQSISKETLAAAIDAAHARDKLAVVHITTPAAARDAINAGADGLVHLYVAANADPELATLAAERGVFVVPTLSVISSLTSHGAGEALAQDARIGAALNVQAVTSLKKSFGLEPSEKRRYEASAAAALGMAAAGVPILAGTDAPNAGTTYGASVHGELYLLTAAGLSPIQALIAATSAPADAFGLADRGRIAAGKRADLLLVEGDPTADIKATRNIVGVWKAGEKIDREGYLAAIEAEKRAAAAAAKAPPPPGSDSGLVSTFDDGELAAEFGAGWMPSTDELRGGKSTVKLSLVAGGAEKSAGALRIVGETVKSNLPFAWAGALFSPGAQPMAPANLSAKKGISFWARGDGRTYTLMLFVQSRGFTPVVKTFAAKDQWQQHEITFADLGIDGTGIMGVFFGAGLPAGTFELFVDDVRFL